MKPWPLVLGMIVLLAVVCSPVLAITKSEIFPQYQRGFPLSSIPTPPTLIPWGHMPIPPAPTIDPTPPAALLTVTSDPAGAMVSLDGMERGITPVTITGLSTGLHKLTVTLSGYQDYSTWVRISIDKTKTVHATLKVKGGSTPVPTTVPTTAPTQRPLNPWNPNSVPIPTLPPSSGGTGSILVTSTPTGAEVYLGGVYKGTTPITVTGVSVGNHQLKVSKKLGIQDYSRRVCFFLEEEKYKGVRNIHVNLFLPSDYDGCSVDGKPNIYLYSDHDLTAQVRLMPEGAIIVSDPVYQPGMGWQAAIWNGSLNGKGDFLFYEGLVPDSKWQKREGYVIRATYRGQDMAFMLGQYGFNEKETAEFIDYWVSHLPGDVDYVFYPQETEAVEQVMPLIISPEPDHVMRIHFYAEPRVSTPEPVTSPEKIVREGFYVVEWGVIVKDR